VTQSGPRRFNCFCVATPRRRPIARLLPALDGVSRASGCIAVGEVIGEERPPALQNNGDAFLQNDGVWRAGIVLQQNMLGFAWVAAEVVAAARSPVDHPDQLNAIIFLRVLLPPLREASIIPQIPERRTVWSLSNSMIGTLHFSARLPDATNGLP
jgi:hypothetical protein